MTCRASLILAVVLSALTTLGAVEFWNGMQRSRLTRFTTAVDDSHDHAQEHSHEADDEHDHEHTEDHDHADDAHDDHDHDHAASAGSTTTLASVRLSAEARKNLGIVSRPLGRMDRYREQVANQVAAIRACRLDGRSWPL